MAKRSPAQDTAEADRIEGVDHPRQTTRLIGQNSAAAIVARALRSRRPPQAWLICGPPGVGKATLAYRIARYLLAYGAGDKGPADLSVPANDPAAVQTAAGSHPGLLVLKRGADPNTGKLMSVLSVGEVRRLSGFFGMTSGAGGWRVAIVDTADDMNDAAANALLKLLEEPPLRAMLLVLSNTPGRLLSTIRSRCQRLNLRPIGESDMETELARLVPDLSNGERASLVRLSGGSLGAALRLAGGDGVMLAQEADRLIDQAAQPDIPALFAFSDKLSRITDGLDAFGGFLTQALAERIRARALTRQPQLDRWVRALEKLSRNFGRTDALHLEPRQTLLGAVCEMSAATRRAGAV
ncbi:MAG: DNA polymerase III subunit delta' [Alphaproteobacteria bacterium]|nr:DNA polymerase III subunit delta' [Alphaproteobacteria bacterium]MDE2492839.1 DNA polymerase III subunit delta' [Alphaproteobacteria bacterium]